MQECELSDRWLQREVLVCPELRLGRAGKDVAGGRETWGGRISSTFSSR